MNNFSASIKRPSMLLLATEVGRAISELGWFYAFEKQLTKHKRGDGHPVLVLPGFMTSDYSTGVLRRFLNEIGYQSFGWDLGRNTGDQMFNEKVSELVLDVYARTGQKMSIIGWSLGGVYARQMAKQHPDLIRQVITLGSPFAGITQPNNVSWIYQLLTNGRKVEELDKELLDDISKPSSVPTTAIYTKEDGIVSWKVCYEKELNEYRQNIQVRSSHFGMGVNPMVLRILANRLQYRKENWQKFEPNTFIDKKIFYPAY